VSAFIRRISIALLAAAICAAAAPLGAEAPPAHSPEQGCRVFICGHSFHIFNAQFLGPIAQLAKLPNHVTVGKQMIGGSSVTQHWNLPDEKNHVKRALKKGEVDVLTLAPNWIVPDPAIEKFVDLGLKHNSKMSFVVQMSWTVFDGNLRGGLKTPEDRNKKTIADLRPAQELFALAIELQVAQINAKYEKAFGRPVVFVSPVGHAVLKLRQLVIDGKTPGLKKQSELFRDLLGHGRPPLLALCTYVNYATIYRRSPEGLAPFDTFGGDVTPELHKVLQQVAWQTVSKYEPSGAVVKKSAAKPKPAPAKVGVGE